MADNGHVVTIACQSGGRLESQAGAAGLRVRTLSFGGDLHVGAILGLARVLRDEKPDVVHAHDPHATAAAVLAARLGGRPRVVASRRVPLRLRGALSRRKYLACDRLIPVSRAVTHRLIEDGLPFDRLTLIYEGVPDRLSPAEPREVLEGLGVPPGSPVIGNVAALTEHKDHETLLRAMPRVLAAVPGARLVIVGEGKLRRRLESLARERGLGGRCVFTGFREDVDRLLPGFSLLCLTSRLEGLGTSLLDAMCFSRPIVAAATGGIPEAVRHGETGLLVPVGDPSALAVALVALLRDEGRRERMGRAGRRRFEQTFTAGRMVEETLRVYGQVCGSLAVSEPVPGLRAFERGLGLTTLARGSEASSEG
jgi:glycosyltransferase involved in cell wall biosynthesis